MRPKRRPLVLALVVAAVVLVADQLSKIWIARHLVAGPCRSGGEECIDLILGFRLHLVYNRGAAFSTGTNLGPLFGVIALAMTLILLNLARTRTDRLGPFLLGMIAGGAVGNLSDRIFRAEDGVLSGSVIDFIDAQWWPVFNVADSAVVVGVLAFITYSMFEDPGDADGAEPDDAACAEPADAEPDDAEPTTATMAEIDDGPE